MIRLIRHTLLWIPALLLLVLVRNEARLAAQDPLPIQNSASREHPPSLSDVTRLAETPLHITGTISGTQQLLWPPVSRPAPPDVGDALLALQGAGCDGADSLPDAVSPDCAYPCGTCIRLEKTGPTSAQPGEKITYTFTVTNCGDEPLSDVWVLDPLVFGCDTRKVGYLLPGESYRFEASYALPTGRCGELVNWAWAIARSGHCFAVWDKASWTVEVPCAPPPTPAVEISKGPQVQIVEYGMSATFAITVTNAGQVDLATLLVDDPQAPDCSRALGALAVGSSESYQCSVPDVTLPFTNVVVVTATTSSGQVVSDQDEARVLVVTPTVSISKDPPLLPVERGGIVTFTVSLTNPGQLALGPVVVRDSLAPDCDRDLDTLSQGAVLQYQCVSPPVTASFTNTVRVTATTPGGSTVTAQDQARVVIGGLAIEKYLGIGGVPVWQEADSPPGPPVYIGTPVWFWFMVRSTGDAPLSGLVLTDSAVDLTPYPDCVPPSTLQPGELFECVAGPLAADIGQHSDTGQVTGEFAGKSFGAEDGVFYLGYDGSGASIDLEKYIAINGGEWLDADSIDAAPEVPAGPNDRPLVQFRFVATNTGSVPLDDMSIVDTDLDLSSCAPAPSPWVPGASYECIVDLPSAVPCLQTNVATATGYHDGLPYSDTDAVHYFGVPCFTPTFYHIYLPLIVR